MDCVILLLESQRIEVMHTMGPKDRVLDEVMKNNKLANDTVAKSAKPLNLGLQGGGAHGAFTWGVLDRLLEDGRLRFDGVSGASSGAMNAVALAHGWTAGGRDGARETLHKLWTSLARTTTPFSSFAKLYDLRSGGRRKSDKSPTLKIMMNLGRFLSPYEFNPLRLNPTRAILTDLIDFERLRSECKLKLFIAATNVRTGKLKLFGNDELSVDSVLASACLPAMHHAIKIDGETYWDGGYSGNPAVFPLIEQCRTKDVLIVLLHPLCRPDVPSKTADIISRTAELSFGSTFLREMAWIARVEDLLEQQPDPAVRDTFPMQKLKVHLIDSKEFADLDVDSKANNERAFLLELRDMGRDRAGAWLEDNFSKVGQRSSVDIQKLFG